MNVYWVCFGLVVAAFADFDEGVNLLQHAATMHKPRGKNKNKNKPDPLPDVVKKRERAMCPHEMEVEEEKAHPPAGSPFGCRGQLYAKSTKECSFWGEPHISATWSKQPQGIINHDVLFQAGLLRMAAAKDGSWEIQVFNCGIYAVAFAMRFGVDIIEVAIGRTPSDEPEVLHFLNGKPVADFPVTSKSGTFFDDSHRKSLETGSRGFGVVSRNSSDSTYLPGACVDHPNGQVYVDINYGIKENLNILIEAAEGTYLTEADTKDHVCTGGRIGGAFHNWGLKNVPQSESLFINLGDKACQQCRSKAINWSGNQASGAAADKHCKTLAGKDYSVSTEDMCRQKNVKLEDAADACGHLAKDKGFFEDCKLDFCACGGDPKCAKEAENEQHAEEPSPTCVNKKGCDPAKACCDALKDDAILDFSNVVTSRLCEGGELRYGSVLTQGGVVFDLIVEPAGKFDCGRKITNGNHGSANKFFGHITIPVGTGSEFNFTFVQTGSVRAVAPKSVAFSFLDLDQGKRGKQKSSVEVCGASNAFVTTNTELDTSTRGDCTKASSTTKGTAKDNPDNPDAMSKVQRARTVAYQIPSASFSANLAVGPSGRGGRRLIFTGHPSVACATD